MPRSLGVTQTGLIFSKRTLITEEAVACLQGKAPVQSENILLMTETCPRCGGSGKESYFQGLNAPIGILKCLEGVQMVLTGLCFGQVGQVYIQRRYTGNPLEESMATHSSILAWKTPQTTEIARL